MKKTIAAILAVLMLTAFAACGNGNPAAPSPIDAALTEAALTDAALTEAAPAEGTPAPTEAPKTVMSPEFAVMDLGQKEYGADYSSLYDAFGESVTIADVKENGQGLAYITRDGKDYELGLDFLSMAMIYNTEPSGGFATAEDVCAEWWRYYALRWNRLLPEIPLYRNEYYTAYNTEITGVAENPVNPFTNKEIPLDTRPLKNNGVVITTCDRHQPPHHKDRYKFDIRANEWWRVKDDVFKASSWEQVEP